MNAYIQQAGRTLQVGDANVYYEDAGPDRGEAVVLLHGGLGTLDDLRALATSLSDAHRVIAVDARGHGRSTLGTAPLTYARLEADVLALVDSLGVTRFSVVGFSDGGIVGLRLAVGAPSRVTKLVLLGTPYQLTRADPLYARLAAVTPESWRAKFPETAATYERLNPAPDFDALVRASVPMWTDLTSDGYPGAAVKGIQCPVFVGRGDEDPLVTRAVTLALLELLTDARFLNVPFAGHEVHKDHPEVVGTLVDRFLRDR